MRDGLCWRHPAAEAGNSAQHATESSGLSVGDVHTRVGGQARTVSVQCAHFRDVPRQRFGSSEGQDIDLYIGPEPTACLLLHSRIAFGHSPILESRLSGTIDEGLDQKKYSAVLVVDARGFFQIQPLKNVSEAPSTEFIILFMLLADTFDTDQYT